MNISPFKTFVKFKKVVNSYEDDCKIFYPTPWDREYLAYRRYCQDRVNEMVLSAYNANIVFDQELLQYFADFPLYAMRSFFCGHEQDDAISVESYEHLPFVPFDSTDVIKIYDNTSVDIQSEHCECSDSQYEESDIDVIEKDSNIRFNLNRVDYGTANYIEFEEYQSQCKHCKLQRRYRKPPSILNLGVFLSNIETKPKVLKRRKVKQFRTRKFEHVSRNSCSSVTSIVNSDINIEEVITVEDCDCNEIPTVDNRMFKMTYSKAVHCKSSKFRLIGKTTSGQVENQIDMKNTKRKIQYSKIVSGNFSRYTLTTPSTSTTKNIKLKRSTASTSNAETGFETVQMDQVATKNNTAFKTYSQALYGKPKSGYPRLSNAPTCDATPNNNADQMSRGKSKTYSQVLYCNLPKSRIIKEKKSQKTVNFRTTQIDSAVDQTVTKDVKTCKTYSEVVNSNSPKSRPRKPPSSNKKVGLRKTVIENTFDQVVTEEVKTYKTSYSQAVYHNLPKSSSNEKSNEQKSTDVKTCDTYTKVVYCTVSKSRLIKKTSSNKEVGYDASPIDNNFDQPPSDEVNTKKTFSQAVSCGAPKLGNDFDQIPLESINEKPKNIKSSKTEINIAKLNKILTTDISEAVGNILPATSLIDQKTSENKIDSGIPNSKLWSKIVSGVSEKPMTPKVDSNTDSKSHKANTVTFSKDTVEMEIDPTIPISSTFRIVSGEIHAITSVQDEIVTYELDTKDVPEIEKPTTVPTCQTWSQIVTGEKVSDASLVCDKIGEPKCNHDVPEIEKPTTVPTCQTGWSQIVTEEKVSDASLVCDKISEPKCNQDVPEIEKPTTVPTCQTWWSQIVTEEKVSDASLVCDKISEPKCNQDVPEIEKPTTVPTCQTWWSQIVTEEKLSDASLVCDKISEPKCNQDVPEIEKPTTVPTCQTWWSQIVSEEKVSDASLVCDKISEPKCNQDVPEIEEKILPTWSKMGSEAILGTSLDCDKTKKVKKESNPEIKPPRVTNEAKLQKRKKSRFVKLDMSNTSPLEETLEKPAELKHTDQFLFSYADIMKTRKTTDASCVNSAPVQTDILLTPPKYRSHVDSSPSLTSHSTDVSNSCKKEKWILQKSKRKRSKRSNKM